MANGQGDTKNLENMIMSMLEGGEAQGTVESLLEGHDKVVDNRVATTTKAVGEGTLIPQEDVMNTDELEFGKAFQMYRGKGDTKFKWRGKEYSTKTADEVMTLRAKDDKLYNDYLLREAQYDRAIDQGIRMNDAHHEMMESQRNNPAFRKRVSNDPNISPEQKNRILRNEDYFGNFPSTYIGTPEERANARDIALIKRHDEILNANVFMVKNAENTMKESYIKQLGEVEGAKKFQEVRNRIPLNLKERLLPGVSEEELLERLRQEGVENLPPLEPRPMPSESPIERLRDL